MSTGKPKPPLERAEDAHVRKLFRSSGFTVISFSKPGKTQQTPGIADLLVLDNRSETSFWFEVKRQKGPEWAYVDSRQSPDQKWFQEQVESHGMRYEIGSRKRAMEILIEMGRVVP